MKLRFAADDFGLNDSVSLGILELAELGLLGEVSAFAPATTSERENLRRLIAIGVAVGLHLKPVPLGFQGSIALDRQIGDWLDGVGSLPTHLDSHLHWHQLPAFRNLFATKFSTGPWISVPIRVTEDLRAIDKSWVSQGRQAILRHFGRVSSKFYQEQGFRLRSRWLTRLDYRSWRKREVFSRDFVEDEPWLQIVHPARPGPRDYGDRIFEFRCFEYQWIKSGARFGP